MMPNSCAEYDKYGYLWDCMDDAKSRLAMLGVTLKWSSEPFISKEELERQIEQVWEPRAQQEITKT